MILFYGLYILASPREESKNHVIPSQMEWPFIEPKDGDYPAFEPDLPAIPVIDDTTSKDEIKRKIERLLVTMP